MYISNYCEFCRFCGMSFSPSVIAARCQLPHQVEPENGVGLAFL